MWCVACDLYQEKGINEFHSENVATVACCCCYSAGSGGHAAEENRTQSYPFLAENYFSSMKLVDKLTSSNYLFRRDRTKGNHPLKQWRNSMRTMDTMRLWSWRINCRSLSGGTTMPQLLQ
jgi:hypothetical protein